MAIAATAAEATGATLLLVSGLESVGVVLTEALLLLGAIVAVEVGVGALADHSILLVLSGLSRSEAILTRWLAQLWAAGLLVHTESGLLLQLGLVALLLWLLVERLLVLLSLSGLFLLGDTTETGGHLSERLTRSNSRTGLRGGRFRRVSLSINRWLGRFRGRTGSLGSLQLLQWRLLGRLWSGGGRGRSVNTRLTKRRGERSRCRGSAVLLFGAKDRKLAKCQQSEALLLTETSMQIHIELKSRRVGMSS